MCFHFSLTSKSTHIEHRAKAKFINPKVKSNFDTPHYHLNGFEHPNLAICTQELPDKILPSVWGIAPKHNSQESLEAYYKKASRYGGGLNARSEKLRNHFIYKHAYKSQRCLIWANAFFEPHHVKSKSYPYLIKRQDAKLFALAGIYTRFENGLITCAILTKDAMPYLAEIHNQKKRQPVILSPDKEQLWLNNTLDEPGIFECIQDDYDDKALESYPVHKKLHKPLVDSNVPDILEPFDYPDLNTLF
jgi:putative SOS response-associated peptidase YedK